MSKAAAGRGALGTFSGVFTPSIMTILGIILFLRLGFVVGEAGLGKALLVIALANLISIFTSVSLSAIATNLRVKGGGDYYLISRTLGLEFGGAIGIVLFCAQAVSIAFYCIGFSEAVVAIAAGQGLQVSATWVAAVAVALLFGLAWLGADWATRFQYVVMGLLVAALLSFFVGGWHLWEPERLLLNWSAPADSPPFWLLFALFFPAVTGFTQGVSMSGDLASPAKSLPLGTFLAVFVAMAIYFVAAVLFSGAMSNADLARDYSAMSRVAAVPWLVDCGVLAATLSSAMASFLGAPRVLQALAQDRIFPWLNYFAKGSGKGNNPRRGVLLAGGIAALTVAAGKLDLIAPIVSMFFLISYGLINYATYYEASTSSPSFRPTFRWFDRRLSLLGGLACLGVMFAIEPLAGAAAVTLLFAVFEYLKRHGDPARWADSRRAYHLQKVREHLLATAAVPKHPRDWRPQLLVFTQGGPGDALLVRLSGWLEGGAGLTTLVRLMDGTCTSSERLALEKELVKLAAEENPAAFPLVVSAKDQPQALHTLLQCHGLGPLRTNSLLCPWPEPEGLAEGEVGKVLLGRQLRTVHRLGCNLLLLLPGSGGLPDLSAGGNLDVFWSDDATGRLMLLYAFLITRTNTGEKARLRLLVEQEGHADTIKQQLADFLDEARIDAEILFYRSDGPSMPAQTEESGLLFCPYRFSANSHRQPWLSQEIVAPRILVMAAEDIDLDAAPEEGIAAQRAKARDRTELLEKAAEELGEKKLQAEEEANMAKEALLAAKLLGAEAEEIKQHAERASQAASRADQKRRIARLAEAKVQEAKSQKEESNE